MIHDLVSILSEYENRKGFPEESRCTKYDPDLGQYLLNTETDMETVDRRYQEALEEKRQRSHMEGIEDEPDWEKPKTESMVYLFGEKISHNMQDTEQYHPDREEDMLRAFYHSDSVEKKLGVKRGDKKIYLLKQTAKDEFPVFFPLPENDEIKDVLLYREADRLRYHWFSFLAGMHNRELKEKSEKMIQFVENTNHALERRNMHREIRKRMQKRDKVFAYCYMEHYDFRGMKDLADALFLQCHLAGADFSGCDLSRAVFAGCDLTGTLFYGCDLNHAVAYHGEAVPLKDVTEWLRD